MYDGEISMLELVAICGIVSRAVPVPMIRPRLSTIVDALI